MAVEKVLYNYYLIIPLLTELASDRVISVLVKRGYVVSSLSVTEKVCLTEENNVVAILSLNIKKSLPSNTKDPREVVRLDVKDVLMVTKTKYYMLWIGEPMTCNWDIGNMKVSNLEDVGPYRTSAKDMN